MYKPGSREGVGRGDGDALDDGDESRLEEGRRRKDGDEGVEDIRMRELKGRGVSDDDWTEEEVFGSAL